MKKLIVALLFILLMTLVFAENLGDMRFNVHWSITNVITTTITILPYSGTGTLPKDEQNNYQVGLSPSDDVTPYGVCLIKYISNKKGSHRLEISATPMMNKSTSEEHQYSLWITFNNEYPWKVIVDPNNAENSYDIDFVIVGTGHKTYNIYLDAVLTGLDEMVVGEYTSTLTLMEITE